MEPTDLSMFIGSTSARLAPDLARSRMMPAATSSVAKFIGRHLVAEPTDGRKQLRQGREGQHNGSGVELQTLDYENPGSNAVLRC